VHHASYPHGILPVPTLSHAPPLRYLQVRINESPDGYCSPSLDPVTGRRLADAGDSVHPSKSMDASIGIWAWGWAGTVRGTWYQVRPYNTTSSTTFSYTTTTSSSATTTITAAAAAASSTAATTTCPSSSTTATTAAATAVAALLLLLLVVLILGLTRNSMDANIGIWAWGWAGTTRGTCYQVRDNI